MGVAEVALYSGYVWHLGQAKKKDKAFKEVKSVMKTWVVGADDEKKDEVEEAPASVTIVGADEESTVRRRTKKAT